MQLGVEDMMGIHRVLFVYTGRSQWSPLYWMSQQRYVNVIHILLEYHVDASDNLNDNYTLLHKASASLN